LTKFFGGHCGHDRMVHIYYLQSIPITIKVEFEPRSCRGVLDTTLCDEVCQ